MPIRLCRKCMTSHNQCRTCPPQEANRMTIHSVTELDAGEMYEVDLFRMDYDEDTGLYLWAEATGCSCWEGWQIAGPDDYDGKGSAQEAHSAVDTWAAGHSIGDSYGSHTISPGEVADAHYAIATHKA
jgi:hypothetical protein